MNSRLIPITATAAALLVVAVALSSCFDSNDTPRLDPAYVAEQARKAHAAAAQGRQMGLASRGRATYRAVCTACHNSDPKKAGTLGPEVWGSSLELLRFRIMQGGYPPGYKPKRPTHSMQPMPQVMMEIPALQAYLNAPSP